MASEDDFSSHFVRARKPNFANSDETPIKNDDATFQTETSFTGVE